MSESLPLSSLLSRVIAALTGAYEHAGAGTNSLPSLAMSSVLLRAVSEEGCSQADLQQLTAVSRRALRATLTGAKGHGWVSVESGSQGLVRLTGTGVAVRQAWPSLVTAAEADWWAMVGQRRSERARSAAAAIVSQFELEWPHHPVSYGTADVSITGGFYRAAQEGPPRIPAHGQDWIPVIRDDAGSVVVLGIDAVLSQALCAFSSDYEQHRLGPIATSLALRRAQNDWVPVADFPAEGRVTGEGKTGLERHRLVDLKIDPLAPLPKGYQGNLVRPSPRGRAVRDAYGPITARVESEWRDRYGADAVEELRVALDDLTRDLPSDLPDYFITRHMRK